MLDTHARRADAATLALGHFALVPWLVLILQIPAGVDLAEADWDFTVDLCLKGVFLAEPLASACHCHRDVGEVSPDRFVGHSIELDGYESARTAQLTFAVIISLIDTGEDPEGSDPKYSSPLEFRSSANFAATRESPVKATIVWV